MEKVTEGNMDKRLDPNNMKKIINIRDKKSSTTLSREQKNQLFDFKQKLIQRGQNAK